MLPDGQGRFWSEQLGVFLGLARGSFWGQEEDWVWLSRPDGSLVPTRAQLAAAEQQRAEAEQQRAEAEQRRAEVERQRATEAEAEVARLRALLEDRRHG